MNKSSFLLFIIAVHLFCSCQKNKVEMHNEWNEWKIKGAVKSITEIDYSKTGKYKAYLLFNANGFIKEQSTYNTDSSLIRKWKYEYNTQNQKLTRSCIVLKDSLSGILHYKYNEADKITEEKLLNPTGAKISNIEHRYDEKQNVIEKRYSDDNGKIIVTVIYKYDIANRLVEEIHSDTVMNQNWKQRYSWNKEGLNSELLYLTLNDSLIKRSTYTYQSNKLMSEAISYSANSELISKTNFEYDLNDNITIQLNYSEPAKTTEKHTFRYTYDQYKNWTFRYEYINDQLIDIISRELKYYN